jgi:hypothetical protein
MLPGAVDDSVRRSMTPDEAARFLRDRFRRAPWFTTVIVSERNDQSTLLLYVETLDFREASAFAKEWQGYRVELRQFPQRVREGPVVPLLPTIAGF